MAPRSVSMAERGQSQNPTVAPSKKVTAATRPKGACRLEDALWLDRVHNDTRLLRAMRRKAAAAFRAHLDVEFNPTGAAQALVRELAHVVDDDCEARHYIEAYNAKHREKRPQRSMSIRMATCTCRRTPRCSMRKASLPLAPAAGEAKRCSWRCPSRHMPWRSSRWALRWALRRAGR